MKLTPSRVLDRLPHSTERPLAAVFCSFTFDPKFFEEQVLRGILKLATDPEEQPARYHEEARRVLQEVPVACIVDAGMRGPGHRLPYDLLDVSKRVFHPKLTLQLFETTARVSVGSGNLTRGGYGDNAESFVVRDLSFTEPEDAALLREISTFLHGIHNDLVKHRGTQLALALKELDKRVARTPPPKTRSIAFIHSLKQPILDQMRSLMPSQDLVQVGVLAPFFELDDVAPNSGEEWSTVLGALAGDSRPKFDLGILWEDPPLSARTCEHPTSIEAGINRLWARSGEDDHGAPKVSYFVPHSVTPRQVELSNCVGVTGRIPRAELEEALSEQDAGVIKVVNACAPKNVLKNLRSRTELVLWLHPAWRHEEGRARRRPLHAKVFLLTAKDKRKTSTLVVVGSPNPSRRAMLHAVPQNGNVECAFAFLMDGEVALPTLCPELIACPIDLVNVREREYPVAGPNYALWIQSAIHDAEARTLTIEWADSGPALDAWSVRYANKKIVDGTGAPATRTTTVSAFDLLSSSCEVDFVIGVGADAAHFSIPITVLDLTQLPVSTGQAELSLRELLALLGRRVGVERFSTLRVERGPNGMSSLLEALFGEGFGPTDVFRAYWAVAASIEDPTLSFQALRVRLTGYPSIRSLWLKLHEAATANDVDRQGVTRDSAWFYGAELVRTLSRAQVPKDAHYEGKLACIKGFLDEVRNDLVALTPSRDRAPWLGAVLDHYAKPTAAQPIITSEPAQPPSPPSSIEAEHPLAAQDPARSSFTTELS